jgi:hypothetical protein
MSGPLMPVVEPDHLDGSRRAALLLHAMSGTSRQWVLEQLPEVQRETLCGLLAELWELGIPADPALLEETLAEQQPPEPTGIAPQRAEAQRVRIGKAPLLLLWAVLRDEPAGLIARLLALTDPECERAFLDRMGAAKRHLVKVQSARFREEQQAAPNLLCSALLARVSERLATAQTRSVLDQALKSGPPNRPRSWWKRPAPPPERPRADRGEYSQ